MSDGTSVSNSGPMIATDPAEERARLLQAVDIVRETLAGGADEARSLRTLPDRSVAALVDSGLLGLKTPVVLGGAEADPLTQMDIIEEVASIDPATGWVLMTNATATSLCGAYLPDAASSLLFAGGQLPIAAVVAAMTGSATPVAGGYRVTGRWSWASGIRHAQWVAAGTLIEHGLNEPPEPRLAVFPIDDVEVIDNWHVAGLEGTGSCDVAATDVFVPEAFTIKFLDMTPYRGGPLYRLGLPAYVANEHAAFALGVGRRALETVIQIAASKRRGYGPRMALADRHVFQSRLGEAELRLNSARLLVRDLYDRTWQALCAGQPPTSSRQIELRASATFATRVALDVTNAAFLDAAGSAVRQEHVLQKCLRDLSVAATHLMVSDVTYEKRGQCLLGFPDVDPMA
jgi:indole-3-acetate monooxygenase